MRSLQKASAPPQSAQGLRRRLSVLQVVGLSIALVAPTVTVVLAAPVVFGLGGTFAVSAALIVGVCAILTGLCLAELGSMYPSAGGVYALSRKVLPGPVMWLATLATLLVGVVAVAVISVGIAPFIQQVSPFGGVNSHVISVTVVVLAAGIALVRVELGATITSIMTLVETAVLGSLVMAAIFHPHRSPATVIAHPVMLGGTGLTSVTGAAVLVTVSVTFALISSYESVLGYAEELKGDGRSLAKAVMWSTALCVVLIAGPLLAAVIAAPDLTVFLRSSTPVLVSIQQAFGSGVASMINVCVIVALFTSLTGAFAYFGRIAFATGRDGIWWKGANKRLAHLNRYGVPGWGVAILALVGIPLAFLGLLNWLVTFVAALMAILYGIMGFAAFWARVSPQHRSVAKPYRMFGWPLPPVIVMGATVFAIYYQGPQYRIGAAILVVVSFVAWGLQRRASRKANTSPEALEASE